MNSLFSSGKLNAYLSCLIEVRNWSGRERPVEQRHSLLRRGARPLFAAGDFAVGTNPSVTIGDVDGDGFADICATAQTGTVTVVPVLLGTGALQLWGAEQLPRRGTSRLSRIADLNSAIRN